MDERMVQDLLKEGLAFLKEQSVMDFIRTTRHIRSRPRLRES